VAKTGAADRNRIFEKDSNRTFHNIRPIPINRLDGNLNILRNVNYLVEIASSNHYGSDKPQVGKWEI